MHPFLFQIGSFRIPTYGVISVLALLVVIFVVRRYARLEGRDPSQITDAMVLTVAVGYVGARLFEVVVNWEKYTASPQAAKLLLVSTGVFVGGLITAIPFATWWFKRIHLPYLQGLDIVALVASIADGVGRWGCFASGCCWGTPTGLPWAVTFPELARRMHPDLPGVPLHPTQIYMSLSSLTILGLLMWLYRRKRFHGQIIAAYLVVYAIARFWLEYVRGDAERGFVFGGLLSTSQFVGIGLAAAGAALYVVLDRRHRASGEPDWKPAVARAKGRR
jgi:phosphatidylglycerol:prolipoprotein diacylglycerol transferase